MGNKTFERGDRPFLSLYLTYEQKLLQYCRMIRSFMNVKYKPINGFEVLESKFLNEPNYKEFPFQFGVDNRAASLAC